MIIQREKHTIDAEGKVPGRLASKISWLLIGKHKTSFQTNIDIGDYVNVVNAEKMNINAKKLDQKKYYRHSGYAAGLKTERLSEIWTKDPSEVLRRAVSRMLPKNKHRNERMKRLRISN